MGQPPTDPLTLVQCLRKRKQTNTSFCVGLKRKFFPLLTTSLANHKNIYCIKALQQEHFHFHTLALRISEINCGLCSLGPWEINPITSNELHSYILNPTLR